MAKEVDERVVEMRLNNQQFEQNAKQSIRTLDDLKKASAMDGAGKGLADLESRAKKFSLGSLTRNVQDVADRFSTMGIIGMRALENITDSAMRTGKALISAFTIDPVRSGFQEYETQINATQTILANTQKEGATIQDVNAALNELNTYADKTIYNFTEMTRNIGTFTAAGVKLQTSVSAIKGIANLAAVSGSTSQQASTAMYQLSQALAAGTVKLQDWNSVVNAGMGGQVFQDALKDTARVHGIAIDQMIKEQGSFRETLQKGWLSASILTETLAKFTGDLSREELKAIGYTEEQIDAIIKMGETANDAATKVKTFTQLIDTLKEAAQSGWTQSWQIIVGDFEEAKELLTDVSNYLGDIINKSAENRNTMLQTWKDVGGRTMLINGLRYAFEGLLSVLSPIKQAFEEVFGGSSYINLIRRGIELGNLTKAFMTFAAGMKLTSERADEFRRIFKGVFAVTKAFATIVLQLVIGTLDILISAFDIVDGGLYAFAASLGDAGVALSAYVTRGNLVAMVLALVASNLDNIAAWVDSIGQSEGLKGFFLGVKEWAMGAYVAISDFVDRIRMMDGFTLENVRQVLLNFWQLLKTIFEDGISRLGNFDSVVKSFVNLIHKGFQDLGIDLSFVTDKLKIFFDFAKKIFGQVGLGGILTIFFGVTLAKGISSLSKFGDIFGGVTEAATGTLEAFQKRLKAKALLDIAKAIAIVAVSLALLTQLDQKKLASSGIVLAGVAIGLAALTAALGKIAGTQNIRDSLKVNSFMIQLALSITVLAGALLILEKINMQGLWERITILGILAAGMTTVAVVVGKFAPQLSKGSTFIIAFALALKVLISALKDIDNLDVSGLKGSLDVIIGIVGGLSLVLVASKNVKMGSAMNILATVLAIKILIGAFEDLAKIDAAGVKKGLVAVMGIIAMMAVLAAVMGGGKNTVNIGDSLGSTSNIKINQKTSNPGMALLAMAAALNLVVVAIKGLAGLDAATLNKGTEAIAKIGAIFIAFTAVSKLAGQHAAKAGAAMFSMAGAITLLLIPIYILSTMDKGKLDMATDAIMRIGGIFVAFTAASGLVTKDSAKAIKTMTVALLAMSVMMGIFTLVEPAKLESASKAILAIGVIFAGLVVVSKYAKYSKDLTKVAGTMVLVIGALGLVMAGLSTLNTEASIKNALALSVLLTALAVAIRIIPQWNSEADLPATLAMIGVMTAVIAAIGVVLGVMSYLNVEASIPNAVALSTVLLALGAAIRLIPAMDKDADLKATLAVMGVMTAIVAAIAVILGLMAYLNIEASIPNAIALGVLMLALSGALRLLPKIPDATMYQGALVLLAEIVAGFAVVIGVLGGLMQIPGAEKIMADGGDALIKFGSIIGGFFGSIVGGFAGGIAAGASAMLPFIGEQLSAFGESIQPFLEVTKNVTADQMQGVKFLCEALLMLTGAELIKGIVSLWTGEGDFSKFGDGLKALGQGVAEFYEATADVDADVVEKAAASGKAIAEFAKAIPNEGGLLGKIMGENDIQQFGEKLAAFAPGFVSFCKSIEQADISNETIEKAMNTAKVVAGFADEVPNEGGWIGKIFGENDLKVFGEKLAAFAPGFVSFCSTIQTAEIDNDTIEKAANTMKVVAAMADNIPNTGGWAAAIFGDNDIQAFGAQLEEFAGSFVIYSSKLSQIEDIYSLVSKTHAIADVLNALGEAVPQTTGGLANIFKGTNNIQEFGTQLESFGESFFNYYDKVADVNTGKLAGIAVHLKSLSELSVNLSTFDPNKLVQLAAAIANLGEVSVTNFTTALNQNTTFESAGKNMMNHVISGIKSKMDQIKPLGINVVRGFNRGIIENLDSVKKSGEFMSDAIVDTVKDKLEIHSPSLVFKLLAGFVAGGWITGMDGSLPDIKASMQEMVDAITNTTADGLVNSGAMARLGGSSMNSLAKGISEAKTPEEAAEAKANAIVEIFKAALDQIDLNFNTKDLEYQLWEALNPGAGEAEKAQMNMAILGQKIEDTRDKADLYQKQYQAFAEEFGATDYRTQEKFNDLLQVQIELAKLENELADAQKAEAQRQAEARVAQEQAQRDYYQYLRDNQDLLEQGITIQQLQKAAAAESGYDPFTPVVDKVVNAADEIHKAYTTITNDYSDLGEVLTGGFTNWGVVSSEAIQNGIAFDAKPLYEGGVQVVTLVAEGMSDSVEETETATQQIVDGANTVLEGIDKAPVIRPVMDMSNLTKGVSMIGSMFGGAGFALGTAALTTVKTTSNAVSSATSKRQTSNYDQEGNRPSSTVVNYTQNLNSPSPVNSTAMYRATKTGLATAMTAAGSMLTGGGALGIASSLFKKGK